VGDRPEPEPAGVWYRHLPWHFLPADHSLLGGGNMGNPSAQGSYIDHVLIEHWNGTAWTIESS
jgi:hypothetical protein